jgi:DNA-binding CsgD family transcriptional regulator
VRELEVLRAVAAGLTSRAIGARLGISPKTVESHKYRVIAKLGVRNRAEAVALAARRGMLAPLSVEAPALGGGGGGS